MFARDEARSDEHDASGALGVKVRVSGRSMWRDRAYEQYREAAFRCIHSVLISITAVRVTHHLGVIGVKVWIFKGEVFDKAQIEQAAAKARLLRPPPHAAKLHRLPRCCGRSAAQG